MIKFILTICFSLVLAPVFAQDSQHDKVQRGLIYLHATGTPNLSTHPLDGRANGVQSQGTGFFVGTDGFILTTLHFLGPLEDVNARQVTITASIGSAGSTTIPVLIAAELERVDLLLLKANIPFDMPPPIPLNIGRTSEYDRSNPTPLFTSGFHDDTYRRRAVEYNASESNDFPYAWTLNVKTNSGQSGSPVYDGDGTVLGIIKATARTDDELTLMIPIEYAMPLIGHLEIDRLNRQVDLLTSVIGELTKDDPPLHERLRLIEDSLTEISSRFTWSADTTPDGSLRIRYEKLIGGGVQVDSIQISIRPFMRFKEAGDTVTHPMRSLRLNEVGAELFERDELDDNARIGEFVIPDVHTKLLTLLEAMTLVDIFGDVVVKEPFRDLELSIIPTVDGKILETEKLTVIPAYEWN